MDGWRAVLSGHRPRRWATMTLLLVAMTIPQAALAAPVDDDRAVVDLGDDEVIPGVSQLDGLGLQATDPLGLLPGVEMLQMHSLGTDVIDVWACDIEATAAEVVQVLDTEVVPYLAHHSRGKLVVDFVAKGIGPSDSQACLEHAADNASPDANGAIVVDNFGGGFGGPGSGENWPANGRFARVGWDEYFATVAAHEYGHMQTWPHSFTTTIPKSQNGEYDNAMDVMSGNYGLTDLGGGAYTYGTNPEPYDTAVINRYAAGWIEPGEVRVVGSAGASFTLRPSHTDGVQMAVVPAGGSYYTLGARSASTYDPIDEVWEGVEVYAVTSCPYSSVFECFNDERYDMGFRQIVPLGRVSFDPFDIDGYDNPLPHVIRAGSSKSIGGRTVSVASAGGGAYQVTVSAGSAGGFVDTSESVFAADIEWLAASGITKGCNPPLNDRFCPDDPVTRGQMAAFLHRALPDLAAQNPATDFVDDDGAVFEGDIEWLSATGVTRGCNPPANDAFCPDDVVTRAQMAAFLHRALPDLPLSGTPAAFVDDNGSTFEADIEWLAATGVTRGCNPPVNDQFCPNAPVTRGAMAAFLNRALAG